MKQEKQKRSNKENVVKSKYFVEGMHCASCEILVEKQLLKDKNIEEANVSLADNSVEISYAEGHKPDMHKLSKRIKGFGYSLTNKKPAAKKMSKDEILKMVFIFLLILIGFFLLERSGIGTKVNVNATSALPTFFMFGLIAGASSCAALVGGLLLSLTKKWNHTETGYQSNERALPFILFNTGRLLSFFVLGGLLGTVGSFFQLSVSLTSALTIGVSLVMLILGLQMLGIKWANKIQIRLPKNMTGGITNEKNFKGKYVPLAIGALTFFLPCGFTIVAQSVALTSGSFLTGASIMFVFALGTLPMLLGISFSSIKLTSKPEISNKFGYIAGMLVVFFAIYNLNSQLNVMGVKSLSDIDLSFARRTTEEKESNVTVEGNGPQIMQMEASAVAYYPKYFKIKAGVPVRWEINDVGSSGCTSAMVAKGLINGSINLQRGMNIVEFTPKKPGIYKATCWMGMVSPVTIEVVR